MGPTGEEKARKKMQLSMLRIPHAIRMPRVRMGKRENETFQDLKGAISLLQQSTVLGTLATDCKSI